MQEPLKKMASPIFLWEVAAGSKGCEQIVTASMCIVRVSAWAFTAATRTFAGARCTFASSAWVMQVLCGMLHPLHGLFQAPDELHIRYVGY